MTPHTIFFSWACPTAKVSGRFCEQAFCMLVFPRVIFVGRKIVFGRSWVVIKNIYEDEIILVWSKLSLSV